MAAWPPQEPNRERSPRGSEGSWGQAGGPALSQGQRSNQLATPQLLPSTSGVQVGRWLQGTLAGNKRPGQVDAPQRPREPGGAGSTQYDPGRPSVGSHCRRFLLVSNPGWPPIAPPGPLLPPVGLLPPTPRTCFPQHTQVHGLSKVPPWPHRGGQLASE